MTFVPLVVRELTQIRKHIAAIVVIPGAASLERIELSRREGCGSNWQCHGLVKPLLAGKTDPALTSLIYMFIAVAASAFYASP